MRLYGEMHRFVPVLAAARGFRVGQLPVAHRPRRHGKSKYGLSRVAKGFLDLVTVKFLTSFGSRPQHLLGGLGVAGILLGIFGYGLCGALWLFDSTWHATEAILLLLSIPALFSGVLLLALGCLAELVVASRGRDADTYSIRRGNSLRAIQQPAERATVHR